MFKKIYYLCLILYSFVFILFYNLIKKYTFRIYSDLKINFRPC